MKKLLLILTTLLNYSFFAQTTYNLNWHRTFTSPASDLSISVGDTVIWTWTDSFSHTVQSGVGSTETFSSGTLTGLGTTYSHTFTTVGSNPYFCGIHGAGNMSGTISVQVLGLEQINSEKNITLYPNPTKDFLQISKSKNIIKSIQLFDASGKKIKIFKDFDQNNLKIDVSKLKAGIYFIEIETNNENIRKQFIKK